ncbi:helix-turn-helix domain protein, partial [Acinetobacter baumannii 45002_8]
MEYIKLSYHHLNFEDRTALMLESRKEGFSARKFAELIKRHPSTIYRSLKEIASMTFIKLDMLLITPSL